MVFLGAALSGCSDAPLHTLTLISPIAEPCNTTADPNCKPTYNSCADLSLTDLHVEVGVFDRTVGTFPCPADLERGSANVMVAYEGGQDFYMIDVSYPQNGSTTYITAGPFVEDQAQTPWKLLLR